MAALGLAAFPVRAQEASAHPPEARIVVLARVAAKTPPIIFGAVDRPLLLVFDGEVGKGVIRAPGVTIHRTAPNALVLTPSRTAVRGPVQVAVPLQTGMATFTLALKPEATDQQVQVYRSEEPAPLAQRRPLIGPMTVPPVKVEPSNAAVPDTRVKCRMGLRVQSPAIPRGAAVEIRTSDSSFCESATTLNMRVGGGR